MKFPVTRLATCVCLVLVALCGCATHPGLKTYHGPDRPDSELILVECDHSLKLDDSYWPYICSVDGFKELNDDGGPLVFPSVKVLPGEHTIEGVMGRQQSGQTGTGGPIDSAVDSLVDSLFNIALRRVFFLGTDRKRVTFTAEAGHTYKLKGDVEEPEYWMWIENAETEELVGGTRPPD